MNIKNLLVSSLFLGLSTTACTAENMVSLKNDEKNKEKLSALTVNVTNVKRVKGQLMVAVHNNKRNFDNNNDRAAFAAMNMKVTGASASFTLHQLPKGNYAVVMFHDENGNGVFDIKGDTPLEGYGISGAKHALDQPSFRKASVFVGENDRSVSVKMHYYK